jgi:DNA-binding protein H-NS
MTDFSKILTRKNSLRKYCQEMTLGEIDKVIADLNDIRVELEEAKRREEEEQLAKKQQVEEIHQLIRKAGIGLDELKETIEPEMRKKSVKAKYIITDSEGHEHTWSGRGRTPVAFREYMLAHNITKEQLPTIE